MSTKCPNAIHLQESNGMAFKQFSSWFQPHALMGHSVSEAYIFNLNNCHAWTRVFTNRQAKSNLPKTTIINAILSYPISNDFMQTFQRNDFLSSWHEKSWSFAATVWSRLKMYFHGSLFFSLCQIHFGRILVVFLAFESSVGHCHCH